VKNIRTIATFTAFLCALIGPSASSAGPLDDSSVGIQLSTLGYGVSFSHAVAPHTEIRVTTGSLQFNNTGTSNNLHYNGSIGFNNLAGLVDFYPAGPFRVTAGYLGGNDHVNVNGIPNANGSFTIGSNTFTSAEITQVGGSARLGSGTYFGVGTARRRAGIGFVSDIGVVFRSVSTSLTGAGPAATTAQFQSDLAQTQNRIQNSISILKTYPVISIGLAARF